MAEQKQVATAIFIILAIIYASFLFTRPIEDDESFHINSGLSVVRGELNPFSPLFMEHYSNPFQYMIGSPLAPCAYALAYLLGGLMAARFLALASILISLYLMMKMAKKAHGSYLISLLLVGFSCATVTLASDGYLDSIALVFFMSALYLFQKKNYYMSGLLFGLAFISKFILLIPMACLCLYVLFRPGKRRFLLGCLIVLVPFLLLYRELLPIILNFVLNSRLSLSTGSKAIFFLAAALTSLPIASLISLTGLRSSDFKKNLFLAIPAASIILFLLFFMDYTSYIRHILYAELPFAVIAGAFLRKIKLKYIAIPIIILAAVNLHFAYLNLAYYPSYNIKGIPLADLDGKVLALNHNCYILLRGLPYNATAETVYSFYYFNYDETLDSKVEEYHDALRDGYFDYAIIGSSSPPQYPRYQAIESYVKQYYCPFYQSNRSNGIDIYTKCKDSR